jgi:phosphate transport system protein
MTMARTRFHDELDSLETEIVTMGAMAEAAVGRAMTALATRDLAVADEVVAADDELDTRYLGVERRILEILAMQTPVASDLRLVSAILHINLHLERVGDQAVNIAKITKATVQFPSNEEVLSHLREMSEVVRPMLRTAIEAFARRDLDLCLQLPIMDDPVDRLNRGMYREVAALGSDPGLLEWGIHMNVVARQLERVGDHAVDIAEQVSFLLTGEFREFSDASHPDEQP